MRLLRSIAFCLLAAFLAAGCRKSPEAKMSKYLETGKRYMAKGDYPRAVLAFRSAAEAQPASAEPVYQLGLAMSAMGDVSAASILFQTATQLDKNHVDAHLKLAELLAGSRDPGAVRNAGEVLKHVFALSPGNADALSTMALVQLRLGNTAEAEASLQSALQSHPSHPGLVVNLARARAVAKDLAGSEKVLLDGIAADPKSIRLVLALAEFYLLSGSTQKAEAQYRRALEIDPRDPAALFALARLYDQQSRPEEAAAMFRKLASLGSRHRTTYAYHLFEKGKTAAGIAELEQAIGDEPENRQSTIALVNAYLAAGHMQKAAGLLAQILSRHSDDVDALLLRARLSLSRSDFTKAAEDTNRAIRLRPQSAEARFFLAQIRAAAGDRLTAQQDLAEAIRLDASFLAARIAMAAMLLENGAAQSALMLLDEAPAGQKNVLPLLLERNWVLLGLRRHAEAATQIEAILKVARLPEALVQKAALQIDTNDPAGARNTLREALALAPEDARLLYLADRAYQGQYEAGEAILRAHVEQRPQAHHLKAVFGRILMGRGKLKEARALMESAVAAAPGLTAAQLDLADLDLLEGKLDNAAQRLEQLAASDRDGSARARIASIQHKKGDRNGAIASYRRALAVNPRNVAVLNNLAYLLAESPEGQDEALRHAEKAKELAPENPAVDDTLGWAYYHKGLYSRAVRHLELAFQQEKTPLRAYHLAMACLRNGDLARGKSLVEIALKLDPALPEAATTRRLLAEAGKSHAPR